jgi:hypothetical protein
MSFGLRLWDLRTESKSANKTLAFVSNVGVKKFCVRVPQQKAAQSKKGIFSRILCTLNLVLETKSTIRSNNPRLFSSVPKELVIHAHRPKNTKNHRRAQVRNFGHFSSRLTIFLFIPSKKKKWYLDSGKETNSNQFLAKILEENPELLNMIACMFQPKDTDDSTGS